jgi:hypothetical protein
MPAHPPPVPPANRSTKGPGEDPKEANLRVQPDRANSRPESTPDRGQQANIKQNTTNPGHQQDR